MAADQPFIKERTFPVSVVEKFKNHLNPDFFRFFKQVYSTYTSVVPLQASLQLSALRAMLSAAQTADWANVSKAAVEAINTQSFMISNSGMPTFASQAEKTIAKYRDKAELICFGCGGNHA